MAFLSGGVPFGLMAVAITAIAGLALWARQIQWRRARGWPATLGIGTLCAVLGNLAGAYVFPTLLLIYGAFFWDIRDDAKLMQAWIEQRFVDMRVPPDQESAAVNPFTAVEALRIEERLTTEESHRLAALAREGATAETIDELMSLNAKIGLTGDDIAGIAALPKKHWSLLAKNTVPSQTSSMAPDNSAWRRFDRIVTFGQAVGVWADQEIAAGRGDAAIPALLWMSLLEDDITSIIDWPHVVTAQSYAWNRLVALVLSGRASESNLRLIAGALAALPPPIEAFRLNKGRQHDELLMSYLTLAAILENFENSGPESAEHAIMNRAAGHGIQVLMFQAAHHHLHEIQRIQWPDVPLPWLPSAIPSNSPVSQLTSDFAKKLMSSPARQYELFAQAQGVRRAILRFIVELRLRGLIDAAGSADPKAFDQGMKALVPRLSGTTKDMPLSWSIEKGVARFTIPAGADHITVTHPDGPTYEIEAPPTPGGTSRWRDYFAGFPASNDEELIQRNRAVNNRATKPD